MSLRYWANIVMNNTIGSMLSVRNVVVVIWGSHVTPHSHLEHGPKHAGGCSRTQRLWGLKPALMTLEDQLWPRSDSCALVHSNHCADRLGGRSKVELVV